MQDVIIIGGGPAGLSASLYAKRAGLSVLVLDKGGADCQVTKATEVENYLGIPSASGVELYSRFVEHVKQNDIQIIRKAVLEVENAGDVIKVRTKKDEYDRNGALAQTFGSRGRGAPFGRGSFLLCYLRRIFLQG